MVVCLRSARGDVRMGAGRGRAIAARNTHFHTCHTMSCHVIALCDLVSHRVVLQYTALRYMACFITSHRKRR